MFQFFEELRHLLSCIKKSEYTYLKIDIRNFNNFSQNKMHLLKKFLLVTYYLKLVLL